MRKLSQLPAITGLCLVAAMAGASAQTAEGDLDLAAIRARAAAGATDADALARTARERAEALASEARTSTAAADANGQRYTRAAAGAARSPSTDDTFDFDGMVAAAGAATTMDMGAAPRFVAFASLSMPPAALREMIRDVTRAGGVVALRGLPGNSARALTAALARVASPGEPLGNVGIDPRLFRAFEVEAVPTYVVAASDFDLCDGFDCRDAVPPHDRMSGNVSAAYALGTFAHGGGPGARLAAQHLARLESPQS
ncbi:type-F conjugative transfer system pilin assembly protein TrbC [Novosphingobium piscinae]|uniref:Type-F conjugative transfer system pilin assembly protein TrbC n=1 Tax=Novosphingobium piscinae TaxID=1507448 RepID=A0A7X1FWF4_9SPHN|nr:type-F conjugative transfer system pilin assembly protein TrbC [Novosphingobium piscinae]MBC2668230.1 type-F conjugative transfer system pilin assembly protein TrbC [Novosphingobium piscinae]